MFEFEVINSDGKSYVYADDFNMVDFAGTVDFIKDGKIILELPNVLSVRRVG